MADTTICECCRHVIDKMAMHGCYADGLNVTVCGSCAEFFWRIVHHYNPPKAAVG